LVQPAALFRRQFVTKRHDRRHRATHWVASLQLVTDEFVGYGKFQLLIFVGRLQRMERHKDDVRHPKPDNGCYHMSALTASKCAQLHAMVTAFPRQAASKGGI
jgi:hypothetical protein